MAEETAFKLISSIEIKYLRSLYSAVLDNVGDLNLLFGRNDSGKSNCIRALNLFFNYETSPSTPLDFSFDFSDARRAQAKEGKSKQFISIKITFNVPENFRRSLGQKISVRRQWNIDGEMTEVLPRVITGGKKTQLTKFLNQIDFTYIPAIKDESVFGDLIERMYNAAAERGGLQRATESFISSIREETTTLANELAVRLGVKSLLSAPMRMGELFRTMDFSMGEERHSLLEQKGDGIKVRHIPELLRYINENEPDKKFFIWGFEEPENSLDLSSAEVEARRMAQMSSRRDTQIFITSHSPVFYLADNGVKSCEVRRYFVAKQEIDGSAVSPNNAVSLIESTDDADEKMSEAGLFKLPALIKRLEEDRDRLSFLEAKVEELHGAFEAGKAAFFVEGASDKIVVEAAITRLYPQHAPNLVVKTKPVGAGQNYVVDMLRAWRILHKHDKSKSKAVGLCDRDNRPGSDAKTLDPSDDQKLFESCKLVKLSPPRCYQPWLASGYKFPIVLESLYPIAFWRSSDELNRLEKSDFANRIPSEILSEALDGGKRLEDDLGCDGLFLLKHQFCADRKDAAANAAIRDVAVFEEVLERIAPTLKTCMDYLFK